jgi:hypothetical protein
MRVRARVCCARGLRVARASAISKLCSSILRDFMMRTMAASICGLRSSSTRCRVSVFSLSLSLTAAIVCTCTARKRRSEGVKARSEQRADDEDGFVSRRGLGCVALRCAACDANTQDPQN